MKRRLIAQLVAFMVIGACLCHLAVSWKPLWRVERPTGHLGEIGFGSFWEFLDDVPEAIRNIGASQGPENILTILPTVYLWDNVLTTLFGFVAGAVLGATVWWAWRRLNRNGGR